LPLDVGTQSQYRTPIPKCMFMFVLGIRSIPGAM
jgi:hypothetical protein